MKPFFYCLTALFLLLQSSCMNREKAQQRQFIMQDVAQMRSSLPTQFWGKYVLLTDINVKGDDMTIDLKVDPELWNQLPIIDSNATDTINYARALYFFNPTVIRKFAKGEYTFKITYHAEGQESQAVTIPFDQAIRIAKQLEDRVCHPFSKQEQLLVDLKYYDVQFAKKKYPVDIKNDMWITKEYVSDQVVHFEFLVDTHTSELSDIQLQRVSKEVYNSLLTDNEDILYTIIVRNVEGAYTCVENQKITDLVEFKDKK